MIGDRVVARLPLRQGADAPAGKAFARHQPVGDACRAIIGGKPAQQHMAGIGAAHPAGSLGAVQRQGIGPEILEPEGGLEAPLQLPGQFLELAGFRRPAERRRHGAGAEISGIGIGLDLGERDGRLGQAAVFMHDGIGAVLPALVDETVERLAVIFEKAVAIGIAETPHPAERRLDMGPDPPDELEVAGPLVIARGQQHEERRGIDAAVIMRERDLAQGRHLARRASHAGSCRARHRSSGRARSPDGRRDSARCRRRAPGRATGIPSAVISPSRPKTVQNQGMPA